MRDVVGYLLWFLIFSGMLIGAVYYMDKKTERLLNDYYECKSLFFNLYGETAPVEEEKKFVAECMKERMRAER